MCGVARGSLFDPTCRPPFMSCSLSSSSYPFPSQLLHSRVPSAGAGGVRPSSVSRLLTSGGLPGSAGGWRRPRRKSRLANSGGGRAFWQARFAVPPPRFRAPLSSRRWPFLWLPTVTRSEAVSPHSTGHCAYLRLLEMNGATWRVVISCVHVIIYSAACDPSGSWQLLCMAKDSVPDR